MIRNDFKQRTEIVVGSEAIDKLRDANILVFGVGGVGGFVVESLIRAGVGNITIVDFDKVDETNINRQIIALNSSVGKNKVDVMYERVLDINPNLNIRKVCALLTEENCSDFLCQDYDFVVDAIDMVKSKLALIKECDNKKLRLISSMGMGNKLDPTKIEISDIYKTEMCPLAKIIRRESKKMGIRKLTVVYSKEKPSETGVDEADGKKKRVNGSVSFVPSAAGLIITSYIVRELIK